MKIEKIFMNTASLAKKHNIPRMSEKRLDNFLHDKEWLVDFGPTSSDWYKCLYFCHFLGREATSNRRYGKGRPHFHIYFDGYRKRDSWQTFGKFHLAEDEISRIMLDFGTFTIPVEPTKKISFIKGDPADDKFLECGIACHANYVVSGDI